MMAILVATSFTSQCDVAEKRAAGLAAQLACRMMLLHVVDEASSEDAAACAFQGLQAKAAALQKNELVTIDIEVQRGNPAAVVAETARAEQVSLVVTGAPRSRRYR